MTKITNKVTSGDICLDQVEKLLKTSCQEKGWKSF